MDDVQAPVVALLDQLTRMVTDARALPMSASCVVNRGEVIGLLEELQRALPEALTSASELLGDRASVVAEGRAEADRIIEAAKAERAALLTKTAVQKTAHSEAQRLVQQAETQAEAMRLEVEEYVDSKLANFEVVLSKTINAVQRGRARLHGESEHDALSEGALSDGALSDGALSDGDLSDDADRLLLPTGDAIPRASRD